MLPVAEVTTHLNTATLIEILPPIRRLLLANGFCRTKNNSFIGCTGESTEGAPNEEKKRAKKI